MRIPLAPMGYQPLVPDALLAGGANLTVHFVDDKHLLVTFGIRRLMKRDAEDPPDDDDRTVGAFLVEIPSGKVIAKTEWRTHDRGQYLWSLGQGRFLLRVRDRLTMIAPMAVSDPDQVFREYSFLDIDRRILAVLVSADDDLLTLETTERPARGKEQDSTQPSFAGEAAKPAGVQINFYRLSSAGPPPEKLIVSAAGTVRAQAALALPLTTRGFLNVMEGGRDRWLFDFDSHAGKVMQLAEWDTSCFPRTTFVSQSEFVAFGCRGTADKQNIAGFNLKGEEMWQQNFFDTHTVPTFAFAPAAGRFALERTIVGSAPDAPIPDLPGDVSSQEVRVYQMYNGKLLFRMACAPVIRAGQNYALSPDGMQMAMLHEEVVQHRATKFDDAYTAREGMIDIYALPPLTAKDQAAVKEAQGLAPEDTGERIDLTLARVGQAAAERASGSAVPAGGKAVTVAAAGAVPAADAAQTVDRSSPAPNPAALGDAQPEGGRKPPTLYAPGETPAKPQR